MNTFLNKRVSARQIPVHTMENQKTSINIRIRKIFQLCFEILLRFCNLDSKMHRIAFTNLHSGFSGQFHYTKVSTG